MTMYSEYGIDSVWLCTTVFVFLGTYYYMKNRNKRKCLPPGPTGLPLVGYIPFMGNHPPRKYVELAKKYGPVFSVNIGSETYVILNDYESIQEALVKNGHAFSGRPQFYVLRRLTNGYGIIFRDFDEHFKEQRKFTLMTLRGFGVGKRSMEDRITEEIEYFTDLIASYNGKSFNCQTVLSTSVSNVICSIAMGSRFSYDDEVFKEMVQMLNRGFGDKRDAIHLALLTYAPGLRHFPILSGAFKRMINDIENVLAVFRDIIEEHRKTFDIDNTRDYIDEYLKQMELRGEEKSSFKEEQLLQTMRDFFLAGTETTSSTLRWCFLCFAHYSKIQEKVSKEVKQVIGSGVPSMSHKEAMPYTCAFIHEITRHRTLVPLSVPHITTEDVEFRGYNIPKGTPVLPNLYAVNHDPNVFKNPDDFKPERFIDDTGKFVPSNQVVPFSVGPRYCLGEQLAKMELFLFLTNIIQRFEIVPDAEKPLPSFHESIIGMAEAALPYEASFRQR
ncbi:cytochrome P450 2H2-like [Styela clava]